jgi:hypothetical protein
VLLFYQEPRNAGIIVAAFVPNARRLTQTPYSFRGGLTGTTKVWTVQQKQVVGDSLQLVRTANT